MRTPCCSTVLVVAMMSVFSLSTFAKQTSAAVNEAKTDGDAIIISKAKVDLRADASPKKTRAVINAPEAVQKPIGPGKSDQSSGNVQGLAPADRRFRVYD